MSEIYLDLLDTNRKNVFTQLSEFSSFGYLGGGTALALQINHRKSFDFDVFVEKEIGNSLRQKIKNIFGDCRYDVNTGDQLNFAGPGDIQITFLWYYFKTISPLIQTDSLPLASIEDIAADKAMTIGRRAVWRDYVDLFFLLHKGYMNLEKIIQLGQNKFGNEFIETQFLEQLSYFQDLSIAPIEYIENPIDEKTIQAFLSQTVKDYLIKKVPGS